MEEAKKLLNDLQAHLLNVVDVLKEIIEDGYVDVGSWELNVVTTVYAKRVDALAGVDESVDDAFQKTIFTDESVSNVLGLMEIAKAEILSNILK